MKHETTVADTINAAFSMIEEVAKECQDQGEKLVEIYEELDGITAPDTSGIALKMTVEVNHWGETTPKPLSIDKKLGNIEAVLTHAVAILTDHLLFIGEDDEVGQDVRAVRTQCQQAVDVIGSLDL